MNISYQLHYDSYLSLDNTPSLAQCHNGKPIGHINLDIDTPEAIQQKRLPIQSYIQ